MSSIIWSTVNCEIEMSLQPEVFSFNQCGLRRCLPNLLEHVSCAPNAEAPCRRGQDCVHSFSLGHS